MSRFNLAGGRFNYEEYRASLDDMACTTDKFMIAKECKGDYHENFDSQSFFKWCVAMELTYPRFCQELQEKLIAHRAGLCHYPYFKDNEGDFWIVDAAHPNGRPARELIMVLDNAAYHKGANCLLRTKTKERV